jgi:plastocyanin
MRAGISGLIACALLTLAAGCGSSSSPGNSTTPSPTGTSPTPSSTRAAGGAGPKVFSTPKYAAPASSAPVQSGTVQIAYRNISIAPDTLKVRVGTTIKWTNYDPIEHNVTSRSGPQSFASKNLAEGKTFQVTLTKPGVIHYLCTIHPATMNGTIEVVK